MHERSFSTASSRIYINKNQEEENEKPTQKRVRFIPRSSYQGGFNEEFMNKCTSQVTNCQALGKEKSVNAKHFSGVLYSNLKLLSDPAVKMLHKVTMYKKHYQLVYTSQSTFGKKLGYCRQRMNQASRELEYFNITLPEKRPSKTHIYHLNPELDTQENKRILNAFFKHFFAFSFILLSSIPRLGADTTQYSLEFKDLFNCTTTTNLLLSNHSSTQGLYSMAEQYVLFRTEIKGEPNRKMSESEAQEIFGTKKGAPVVFTQEQLAELAQYPKQSIEHANKMVTKDLHSGKAISNPFGYLLAICRTHAEKQQTPKTGMVQPHIRPKNGPQSVYKHEDRVVESDYEFAFNVERLLHDKLLNDTEFHSNAARYANPKWNIISLEDQQEIMQTVHEGCACRDNVDLTLHNEKAVLEVKKAQETQVNIRNWNEMIMKAKEVVPELALETVSDNIAPIMSIESEGPPLGSDYIGEYEETFDDCH